MDANSLTGRSARAKAKEPETVPATPAVRTGTHTPGPWQRNGSHIYGPDTEGRRLVARICYEGTAADDANSDVILAAPEIYEACRWFFRQLEEGVIVRNIEDDGHPDWHIRMMKFAAGLGHANTAIAKAEGK